MKRPSLFAPGISGLYADDARLCAGFEFVAANVYNQSSVYFFG